MTPDSEIPSTSTAHSANGERATYILQIDQAALTAMADRMRVSEGRVIDIALGRLYLALLEGEAATSREDFYWEIRQCDTATFQSSPELPPELKSDQTRNLFDLICI